MRTFRVGLALVLGLGLLAVLRLPVVGATGQEKRLLYVASPGIRNDVQYGGVGVLVYDIDNGHRWVKRIPTPQIQDGETGWLVDSATECADACLEIMRDPGEARTRALRGKEYVRTHFLTPRLLRDWLTLFNRLTGNDTGVELATVGAE